ncbi:MAG: hypothetical protein K2G33_05535 [Duncaniella sp.]|nr:hypothetical protein [Duncaniella sp.]
MAGDKSEYIISPPDVEALKQWGDMLNSSFNKGALVRIANTLRPLFDKFRITQQWMGKTDVLNDTFEEILARTSTKKGDYVSFLSRFFSDPSNRTMYFNSLSPELIAVWREIERNYYVSATKVNGLLGKDCVISSEKSYYYGYSRDESYIPETGWFTAVISGGWSRKETSFSLSPILRKYLLPYLPSNSADDKGLDELPDENLTVFDGEKDTLAAIPLIRNLFMNGTLQMGKTRIPATSLKNMSKMLDLKEFFAEAEDKDDKEIRTRFLLTAFALYGSNTLMRTRTVAMSMTSHELIHEMLPHIMYYSHHLTNMILPMLSKIYTAFTQFSYVSQAFTQVRNAVSEKCADNKWHSYDSLETLVRKHENNEFICTFVKPKLMEENDISNTRTGNYITHSNIYAEVGLPFLQGIIFTMAALGMVQIAYYPTESYEPSPYQGLNYIRLTALGRYALGLDKEYVAEGNREEEQLFELSDEKLIIRSLSEANPYESMLNDIANPIGNHRYAVTTSSFLRSCTSVINITQKISTFRQLISPKPPENWEKFFKQLKDNTGKVTKTAGVYMIYEIDPSDLRLHEIIATDPTVRKITRRAENYLLLIESGKFALFRERLKTYGYLV